jgi:hypothetical protein
LALAAVLGAGAAAAAFFVARQSPLLTARDTLVLADFDNRTGDAAFDYTLKQADHGEHRGVGRDAERQSCDYGDGKAWRP